MKNANPVSGAKAALLALLLMVGFVGCERDTMTGSAEALPAAHFFALGVGEQTVQAQLAISDDEMERGLMYRTDLQPSQGMLFVYKAPRQLSFWMRNTPTPLDIGFFSGDGVLREVYPLHPFDERSVSSQGDGLQFALEMPQGWFQAHQVRPGARLDLDAVAAAVEARGFRLTEFRNLK